MPQIMTTDSKAKVYNSIKIPVIARDKVRYRGEILVPGQQYEMTSTELGIYAKHVTVVARKPITKTDAEPAKKPARKKKSTTSRKKTK